MMRLSNGIRACSIYARYVLIFAIGHAPIRSIDNIFDASEMQSVEIIELQAHSFFKTWLARHNGTLILVTDYRNPPVKTRGVKKIAGQFVFTGMKKILHSGTEYELPVYAVFDGDTGEKPAQK